MEIEIKSSNFMNHLAYYVNLKDEDIIYPNGIDVVDFLETILERDLCKSVVNNITNKLKSL